MQLNVKIKFLNISIEECIKKFFVESFLKILQNSKNVEKLIVSIFHICTSQLSVYKTELSVRFYTQSTGLLTESPLSPLIADLCDVVHKVLSYNATILGFNSSRDMWTTLKHVSNPISKTTKLNSH